MATSLCEVQENEVIALQAIYGQNFVDLREKDLKSSNIKNKSLFEPPFYKITLFPSNSDSQDRININKSHIDFKVKCSSEYPNE